MLDKVKLKQFKEIVGTKAVLTVMDGPDVELTVEEVIEQEIKDDDDRPKDVRSDPFTVVLSGPESHQAPDGSYAVTFEKVGVLVELFVDNKADTPECEQFNEAKAKEAAEALVDDADADEAPREEGAAAAEEPPVEPEKSVLYEIVFG